MDGERLPYFPYDLQCKRIHMSLDASLNDWFHRSDNDRCLQYCLSRRISCQLTMNKPSPFLYITLLHRPEARRSFVLDSIHFFSFKQHKMSGMINIAEP